MSDSTFLFHLCGTTFSKTIQANNRNLDEALTDAFHLEEGSFLTYHYPSEECFIQRPLDELNLSVISTVGRGRRQLQIHIHRRPSHTEPSTESVPQHVTTHVRSIEQQGHFHARISFAVENAFQAHEYDEHAWPDAGFSNIDLATTVERLHGKVNTSIAKRIENDHRLGLLSPEAPNNFFARYTVSIEDPSRPGRLFRLQPSQPYFDRISSIRDVDVDPRSLIDTRLSMTAHIRACLVGRADEFDDSERTATEVLWPLLADIESSYPPDQVRIGSTRVRTGKRNDVYTEYALVANLNEDGDAVDKLLDVDCWSIDGLCIIAKSKDVDFSSDFIFFPPFEEVTSLQDIEQIILDRRLNQETHEPPIKPDMTFNIFDKDLQGPPFGAILDENMTISVVVNFIHHLKTKGLSSPLQFKSNMQLEFDRNDTDDTITALLNKELKDAKGTTNLFKGKLKGTWKMELWVMPQGLRQLYRFQAGAFKDFLRQEMVDSGKRRAYMECHIWSAGGDTGGL